MATISTGPPSLIKSQKAFYGVGHILNDLCANCWFSYALIYWTKIVGLSETDAGLLLLIGQVADAISTIFIGYACDKTKFRWYGKRKLWHVIGTICVMLSFPFVFNLCLTCENSEDLIKLMYYAGFVIVFQFGWAATQISHLALIPEIAHRASDIIHLNSIRSGFLFVSGIFVYGITWFLLGRTEGEEVDSSLAPQFKYLSIIVICVGLVFTIIFHVGTKEERTLKVKKNNNDIEATTTTTVPEAKKKKWKQWLKDSTFYKTGLLYMCTRLTINVYQSFFVLYLTDALHFKKEAIAYFPLILLVCGAVTSTVMQKLTKKIGSQFTYILGASLIIGGSVWLFSIHKTARNSVYGATVLAGCGISIVLVTSLAKTADMIGEDKESGAFVYSCMSFLDKLSTGIVIFAIQALKPSSEERKFCTECEWFSKIVQSVVPGGFAVIGLLSILFLFPSEFTCVKKDMKYMTQSNTQSNLVGDDIEIENCNTINDHTDNVKINENEKLEIFYKDNKMTSFSNMGYDDETTAEEGNINEMKHTDINSPVYSENNTATPQPSPLSPPITEGQISINAFYEREEKTSL